MALGTAVKRWIEVYQYTFTIFAEVSIYFSDNIRNLDSPCALLISLAPGESPKDEFALEFRVTNMMLGAKASFSTVPFVGELWSAKSVAGRQATEASYRAKCRSDPPDAPRFVGILPVLFYLEGSGHVFLNSFPIFEPPAHLEGALLDERLKNAVQLTMGLCMTALKLGFVFAPQEAEDAARCEALPKVMKSVRKGEGWRWKAADREAWSVLSRGLRENKGTTLSAPDVFAAYQRMWPFLKDTRRDQAPILPRKIN